jgi:hypothetical protein
MERIVNLQKDHYVIWSTIVDAPVTMIKTYKDMEAYIKSWPSSNYSENSKKIIYLKLLENAKKWGVSTQLVKSDHPQDQIDEIIFGNRAGDSEEELTLQEIIEKYSS